MDAANHPAPPGASSRSHHSIRKFFSKSPDFEFLLNSPFSISPSSLIAFEEDIAGEFNAAKNCRTSAVEIDAVQEYNAANLK
jgi:hypothetical protein